MSIPFTEPDFNRPLDLQDRLSAIPRDATIRGLFFRSALEQARATSGRTFGRGEYTALSMYPLRELVETLPSCAAAAFPDLPIRTALRRMGNGTYASIRESTAGTFVLGVAGRDAHAAVRVASKLYNFLGQTQVTVAAQRINGVEVQLRNAWTFPECYHLGMWEEAIRSYGHQPRCRVRVLGLCDVDLEISW